MKWYRAMWAGTPWRLLFDPAAPEKAHDLGEAPPGPALYELAVVHPDRPHKRVKVYVGLVKDYAKLGLDQPWMFWALMRAVKEGNSVWFRVCAVRHAPFLVGMLCQNFDHAISTAEDTRCVWATPRRLGRVRVHSQPLRVA